MQLVRTTLRLKSNLKKAVEKHAFEDETTFQAIVNTALEKYLFEKVQKKAKKLVFMTHDLGTPLDNLTRDDYYDAP